MVRRTACHSSYFKDPDQEKAAHRTGTRIQFGIPDERVNRLMGLLDSIPTMHLV